MSDKRKRFSPNAQKTATMKDVAELAKVSISTVSHKINNTRYVSPEIGKKIDEAIKELGFSPNPVARVLRGGKSALIGFVVSNLENSFLVRIAKGLEKVLHNNGYDLLLMDSAEDQKREISNVEALVSRGLEGLVIVPTNYDCSYLENILPPDYPLVFVDRPSNLSEHTDTILLANERAAQKATEFLFSKNITEIGFVGLHFGTDAVVDVPMQERIEGYRLAHEKAGIPINEEFIKITYGTPFAINELRHADAYHMTERLLKSGAIEAIICGNDLAAVGVYSCLKDNNIAIPKDLSLITFDDGLWLQTATPQISAIVQPAESFGVLAGQRIIRRLRENITHSDIFRLDAELVIRGSS